MKREERSRKSDSEGSASYSGVIKIMLPLKGGSIRGGK